MQIILDTGATGLRVLGGIVVTSVLRGAYRGIRQRRANLRQIAAMRARIAYDRAYRQQRADYDAAYLAAAGHERSSDE